MSCSDVQTIKAGDGSKTQFSFDFPYIFKSEIHVYFWNVTTKEWDEKLTTDSTHPWRITDANPTIVEFTGTAPPAPATPTVPNETAEDNVRIRRITKVDDIRALFNPGSAIRSDDLNNNFEQLRYAIQESNCQGIPDDVDEYLKEYYWDRFDNTLYVADTWVSDDTKIATTAAMDARFLDETNETYTKAELAADSNVLPDDDVALPTTGTLKDYVDHAVETDILVNDTGLTKTATGGQVTLGIGEGSVDLDRIKPADIITSSESNPNNDTTIATTAKIDDMIDAAITGDIAVDSTGLTVTNDGDGTITLGIGSNSVDFDRIKNDDIITKAEQDSGSPAAADSNIFTASAAAKRFDTLVQTGTPSESSYEVGKTWLQNDDDQTLKIWNGSTWLDVASGGSFRTQDKVIYVDKTGGDDSKTGHRISGPKLTIKAAINDINADISTSIKTGGSGYADGTYQDVPLTGGTTGSGLTADITVSGGAVTAVTDINASTLEEYQIGDILSAADSNLGNGGGSGFELEVTGGGDGMTVIVAAGTYQEIAPIQIKRRNVSIIGMALRSCLVHPTVATEKPSSNGNSALFELNSGSFIQNLTLTGMQASSSGTNTIDSVLPDKQGWNFAFYDDAFITKSPYIQNCTNFSDSQIDNSDLRAHRPRGGSAGDLTNAPTGGGMLVDGSVPKTTSPLRSMVADSYTHVGLNGPGILVTNNGYAQCTSSYAFFNKYHIKALNGGQANLAASTTDFGEKALVADGKSTSAIFTATVNGAAADGDLTFDIDGVTAGTGWFGDDTKPASNMLVTVNSVTYPILSSTVITGGHRVTVSRPDPNNRSTNLGLNGAVADDAAVSFFLRSQIASSGHTMEYVGSGMDYDALPENGGVPDESAQITELNNGKVWTAITDHNGKFKIGGNQTDDPIFEVDQQLGFVTIPEGSIAFNTLSDLTPQLGGNLDVNGNEIVSDSDNENIVLNPHGTGVVDVSTSRITNVTDPSGNQDAATKAYVDTQVAGVTTPDKIAEGDTEAEVVDTGTDGHFKVTTDGTERIRIDSSGNVGIGTSSPSQSLTLRGEQFIETNSTAADSGNGIYWQSTTSGWATSGAHAAIYGKRVNGSNGYLRFDTRSSGTTAERMRIDSSGRLLLGTTSARANFLNGSVTGLSQVEGSGSGTSRGTLSVINNATTEHPATLLLGRSNGTAVGSNELSSNGQWCGRLGFMGNDGSEFVELASVSGFVDGTPDANDMPGRLSFRTTASGASSPTERMRIHSGGNISIGATTNDSVGSTTTLTIDRSSGNGQLSLAANGTVRGRIFADNSTSDFRIGNPTDNDLMLFTNNTERLRIDNSGNVGIGTSSPALSIGSVSGKVLHAAGAGTTGARFQNTSGTSIEFFAGSDAVINTGTSTNMAFKINDSEKMRIDSSGNVGIGTSSPVRGLHLATSGNNNVYFHLTHDGTGHTNADGADIRLNRSTDTLDIMNLENQGITFHTNGENERMRIASSGNVGIGTSSPTSGNAGSRFIHIHNTASTGDRASEIVFTNGNTGTTGGSGGIITYFQDDLYMWNYEGQDLIFGTNATERMRLDTSGRLLVNKSGTPTEGNGASATIFMQGNTNSASGPAVLGLARGQSATEMNSGASLGIITFTDDSGNDFAQIKGASDATSGSNDHPGRITFLTTPNSSSDPQERARITNNGDFLAGADNATEYGTSRGRVFSLCNSTAGNIHVIKAIHADTSFAETGGGMLFLGARRSSTSSYSFCGFYSGNGSTSVTSDKEFSFRGDGTAFADGSFTGGGADYAEYFEWSDGNTEAEDRRGISVVLDGDKIREAAAGEEPIGVISGNPSVVGDGDIDRWKGKYLRDDYGTYLLQTHNVVKWTETITDEDGNESTKEHDYEDWDIPEGIVVPDDAVVSAVDENGKPFTHRILNPDYNPDAAYVNREDRAEWDTVGLMGKLRIRKGQVTGARWIKMRDVSDTVEEWLVR